MNATQTLTMVCSIPLQSAQTFLKVSRIKAYPDKGKYNYRHVQKP